MENYLTRDRCYIHSLDGELGEATIIKKLGDNQFLADYNGVKCTAIYNLFTNRFYVDDKYGVIEDADLIREAGERELVR